MWRPFHMIGLETSISILSAVLRGEPTGVASAWNADVVATAKRAATAPDIPTVIEANLPYLLAENFIGVSAPAQM